MGEARRKKLLQAAATSAPTIDQIEERVEIARVSGAIRKLSEAASAHLGRDCHLHAALCREILSMHGVETRLVIGFAAWRVGDGHGDVILHAPIANMIPQGQAVPFHAWLEIGPAESRHRIILDFTTYQLRQKAAEMDQLDGGRTTVEWCPDYLAAQATQISSLKQVTMKNKGLFFYQHNSEVERRILRDARSLDQEDLDALLILYRNPHVQVFGPNDQNR
ncbi:hypothetical protein [Cupriavidus sp. TMH.W2]|uniref:hypothetical protein n=1 Tax=Cupriavidus sp. TMH.W2 TaxID=3434465 RepID=UPI003D77EDB0